MAERIRITFDVPERVRRALNIAAAERSKSVGSIIESLVSEHLSEYLDRADIAIAAGEQTGKQDRGRPSKK